jgi:integrase
MIYRRGNSGIYSYRFRFAGRMIHESARTKSKTLAREAERQRRRELEERINGIKKRGLPPTFEIAAKEWMESRTHVVAKNTFSEARRCMKHLVPTFGPRLICDITPDDIAAYQRKRLQAGVQNRTVNLEIGELRKVLKANDAWLPFVSKYRKLRERTDVAIALSPEQERALLRATARIDSACHTAAVLCLNTAMRSDEIRRLQWTQIDLEKRCLVVGHSKTEAGEGRTIPLNVVAFEALVRWAARFRDTKPEHYIFPRCENRQIDLTRPTMGWRTAWRHALKQAGFHCRFHDLRHTCITKLAEGQASEMTIMAVAGHVSKKMLERYSHIRMAAKRTALDGLVPISERGVFEESVHQNVHQAQEGAFEASSKSLN